MPASHETLLRALVEAVAPRTVLEVASSDGSLAPLIAEAGSASIGTLSLLGGRDTDTAEAFPPTFAGRVRRHEGLTLNVLAGLTAPPDLVVLGGDPNFFTVFHALRLLARCAGTGRYPVTVVRDAGWPYGRRDAYPQPDAIAAVYLQPHARRGVLPGRSELEHGGLRADANHSLYEGTEKNGVRTAVEDFAAQSGLPLDTFYVPGFHGISLLIDRRRSASDVALTALLRDLQPSPRIVATLDELERARLDAVVDLTAQRADLERRAAERVELAIDIAELRGAVARAELAAERARGNELRIAELDATRVALEDVLTRTDTELRDARSRIADLESRAVRLEAAHARSIERDRALADAEAQLGKLRAKLARKEGEAETTPRASGTAGAKSTNGKSSKHGSPAPSRQGATNGNGHGNGNGVFARVFATAAPTILQPAAVELASRRLAKLRRDPKLFLAHSRFELARKLARLL